MSLLNEMLHDLNKQKSAQVRPSLTAALSQQENSKINRFMIGGAGLVLLLVIGFIFKPKSETGTSVAAKHTQDQIISSAKIQTTASKKITVASQSANTQTDHAELKTQKAAIKALKSTSTAALTTQDASTVASISDPVVRWRETQMNKAVLAIKQGDTNSAKTILQDILVNEPSAINAREKLASVYLSLGDFANATKVIKAGLEYAPEDPTLVTVQAKILMGQDKSIAAIKLLKNDHPSMTTHPEYYATLALALESKGHISEAGTYYKSLIKVDPYNGKYWLGYAVALEYDNKKDQAINAYMRASQNASTEVAVKSYAEDRLRTLQG